jgi:hypothetical protein
MSLSELQENYRILCTMADSGMEYVAGATIAHHAAIVRNTAWNLYAIDIAMEGK